MIISKIPRWVDKKHNEVIEYLFICFLLAICLAPFISLLYLSELISALSFHWLWIIPILIGLMEFLYWLPVLIVGKYGLPYSYTKNTFLALKKAECLFESWLLILSYLTGNYIIKNYFESIKEYLILGIAIVAVILICIFVGWVFLKFNALAINEKKRTGNKPLKRYICAHCGCSTYLTDKPKPSTKCSHCGGTKCLAYNQTKKKGFLQKCIDFMEEEEDE